MKLVSVQTMCKVARPGTDSETDWFRAGKAPGWDYEIDWDDGIVRVSDKKSGRIRLIPASNVASMEPDELYDLLSEEENEELAELEAAAKKAQRSRKK